MVISHITKKILALKNGLIHRRSSKNGGGKYLDYFMQQEVSRSVFD